MSSRHLILNLFFYNPQGDYRFSWRHPAAVDQQIFSLEYYRKLAAQAEAATLDNIFIADHYSVWDSVPSGLTEYSNLRLEPLTLLSALAAVTRDIGLMGTASTTYHEPYNLARFIASMDWISEGRVSWNIVTSWLPEEAANFGRDALPAHQDRYQRAAEFIRVVTQLWDSWQDDALQFNKQTGVIADPNKVHTVNHQGDYFQVRGPLNVPRPPQGRPVLVQAGSSAAGKQLAAEYADMHFVFIRSIEQGLAYRQDMNQRLLSVGRRPESLKIIAGVLPVVIRSEEEKTQRLALNQQLSGDEMAIDLLSSYLKTDLRQYPRDQPLPELPESHNFDGIRTLLEVIKGYDPSMSLIEIGRQLLQSSDSWLLAGTAEEIADQLITIFDSGAADGFNLMFPYLPTDFDNFTREVVPLLKQRGVMRQQYAAGNLREKLGLPAIANQFIEG
ncbi:monooxygenase [Tatumella morbirosei]|uniref:Monooxygenase n=1 Tax=Tatumella morbirosei TaxID=642227 RepID=A0A095UC05_9GAMM|nr:LLM class flavin-dependent oxidoreductase [Tatumella morbirosei]KGD71978.1 monooxygenase [Tatumella morbirosei]